MKQIFILIFTIVLFIGCTSTTINNTTIKEDKKEIFYISDQENIFDKNDTNITTNTVEVVDDVKEQQNIALIFSSSKLGKYALDVSSTINSFLIYKSNITTIKIFDIDEEQFKDGLLLDRLKKENIKKVIALLTNDETDLINRLNTNEIVFYFPLLNINDIDNLELTENLIFGAIDYKKQFETIFTYLDSSICTDFYDNTPLGETLHSYIDKKNMIFEKKIDNKNGNYKYFLKNSKLLESILVLNTPIIKSSILLSQISALDIDIKQIISSQINYTPLLLSLTQEEDRKNILLANSIGYIPVEYVEYAQTVDVDLLYNWVNYTSVVGLEYLLSNNIDLFKDLSLKNNQVIYPIKLYRVNKNKFVELKNKKDH
ncbi:MAG: hypothetical protein U9O56_06340 [Campylobacterota bacterium]|nr:hypothetical protein [Campylobacterota bacterium]